MNWKLICKLDDIPQLGSRVVQRATGGDIAVFRTGPTSSPEEDLLRLGGAATLEAVMAAGTWKALGGELVDDVPHAEADAARATERARAALGR